MTVAVFTNLASSLLASGITNADTSLTVGSGEGALFPAPAAGQHAIITLEDVSGNVEFVKCTGRTGDALTIVRAQEGSAALAFASGSRVECRPTAGVIGGMLQKAGGDVLTGTTTLNGTVTMGGSGRIQNGELVGTKIRGTSGDTSNQISVPTGGGAPTIGTAVILTEDNLVNSLPANAGLMLTGMVCFWFGASVDIPDGFTLCDGTAGTPDLRDKFIVGGGGALPVSGGAFTGSTGSNGAVSSAVTGGHAVTVSELPAHSHDLWVSTAGSGSTHNFDQVAGIAGDTDTQAYYKYNHVNNAANNQLVKDTGSGAAHTHTIPDIAAHTHTYTQPPYRALFAIMKT